MRYLSRAFWIAAGERAVKTFAQTLAALLAASGAGVLDVDWSGALSIALTATAASLLSSIASGAVGPAGPSLATEGLRQTTPFPSQPAPPGLAGTAA